MDTNIQRVVHRLSLGFEYPAQASNHELDSLAIASIPPGQGHDWNSAMMDLGATICTVRSPKCLICPMRDRCVAAPITSSQLALLAKKHIQKSPQAALPFEQTTRYLRGRVVDQLRDLTGNEQVTMEQLRQNLAAIIPAGRLDEIPLIVEALLAEGIVAVTDKGYALASI
jgi:A/G-specific adenine glycosylase